MTLANLPKIIRFTGLYDGGPTDGGRDCVNCPHCGAKGRYIFHFKCEDGNEYGAMRGCLKLFPVSEVATYQKSLMETVARLRQRYGKEAKLNSWGQKMSDAIEAFYAGDLTEAACIEILHTQSRAQATFRAKRYS